MSKKREGSKTKELDVRTNQGRASEKGGKICPKKQRDIIRRRGGVNTAFFAKGIEEGGNSRKD